jgi:hypothetical protein
VKTQFTERRLRNHRLVPRSQLHTKGAHQPGEPFQMADGRWYEMDRNGGVRRLKEKPNGRS